jgi:two-component system, LytTR family, response regulator LytT
MRILVVEDEKIHLEDILISLEELGHECVGSTDDPMEALELAEQHRPDAVIQDINLNGKISGIKLAQKMIQLYQLPVIFATSYRDANTINDALDVKPVTYLTKPVQVGDLEAALHMAQRFQVDAVAQTENAELTETKDDFIFVRIGAKLQKINFENILLVQTDAKNYCTIITQDDKKFAVRNSIQALANIFPVAYFMQVHRAYMINVRFVESYNEAEQCIVIKKYDVPVGRTFKEMIHQRFRVL